MRIDFYHLSRDPVAQVVATIAARVLDSGHRLLVVDSDEGAYARLSRALWSSDPASFLAHGRMGDDGAATQPILIGADAALPPNAASHIALVDGIWRDEALAFDRTFYFFDDGTVEGARAAWRALKEREGAERHYWKQDGRRWVEAG